MILKLMCIWLVFIQFYQMQLLVIQFKIISYMFYVVEISVFKIFKMLKFSYLKYLIIQGDQKVSVHLMITIQKVTSNVQSVPRQSPDIY
jgi:hypothetical protein